MTWYIAVFDAKTGKMDYLTEFHTSSLPSIINIPNQIVWVPK
jgi:hypothetical protein